MKKIILTDASAPPSVLASVAPVLSGGGFFMSSSSFMDFCLAVFAASSTEMDFPEYFDLYHELLKILWFNPEVDTHLAIEKAKALNPSGVVFGGFDA